MQLSPPAEVSALELVENSEWSALSRVLADSPRHAEESDDFGMLPLHWACTDKHVPFQVVKQLVEANPEAVLVKNQGGLMPLHIAVKAKASCEVLRALVEVDDTPLCIETPSGETPAELAEMVRLPKGTVLFLSEREDKLRASGRAPARMSRRRTASQPFVDADQDKENMHVNQENTSRSRRASGRKMRTSSASISTPLPPRWKLDKKCHICTLKFSYFKSRHHCRNCGESVCNTHSNRRLPLRHFGLDAPQRVCILCYDDLRENGNPPSAVVNLYSQLDRPRPRGTSTTDDHVSAEMSYHNGSDHDDEDTVAPPPMTTVTRSSSAFSFRHHGSKPPLPGVYSSQGSLESLVFDDNVSLRPRARTELQSSENFNEMQDQVRELEQHVKELQLTKKRIHQALEESNRKIHSALKEKLRNETRVATLRQDDIVDVSRVSDVAEDTDDKKAAFAREANGKTSSVRELSTMDVASTCNYLGMALFEKGEFSSAILEFRKSLAMNDRDADVWYNLARALHSAEELDDAELAIRKALELRPQSYSSLSLLGKILHSKGDHEESIAVFRQALGIMTPGDESDSEDDVGSMTVGW